jgi:predicted phage terminase large subunit-like protein
MTQEVQIPSKRAIHAELGRRKLIHFATFTDDDYKANWHHKVYADVLDRFIDGDIKRLIVQMPPQHGKSQLCSRNMPAMILGKYPDTKVAITSYNHDFTATFNRDVQRIIESDQYKILFPETTLNAKNVVTVVGSWLRNASQFEIVGKKGSLKSVGVGGSLTGSKVDVSIVDDPYKDAADAFSTAYERRLRDWWDGVLKTRLHRNSKVCLTLTRWKDDDIVDYVKSKSDGHLWHVIKFEAIKETFDNDYDERELGEGLWNERHSLETLNEIKKDTPSVFQAMYQQNPVKKGGNIIKAKYFIPYEYSDLPKGVVHAYLDTALSDKSYKNNDPSGILFYQLHRNSLYLKYFEKGLWSFNELMERVKQLGAQYFTGDSILNIENKANGKSVEQELKRVTNFNVKLEEPKGDKVARVMVQNAKFESGRVLIPSNESFWTTPFIEQCGAFPMSAHDEEVDTLTGAMRTVLDKTQILEQIY